MDQLTKTVKTQILVFAVIALVSILAVGIGYIGLPTLLFGIGRYTVVVDLPTSGNLYASGNVSYRGTTVGRVEDVRLTDDGVQAVLSLDSSIAIPSDLTAEVHSQTAVGEQYVALVPKNGHSAPLKDGDVIPQDRAVVPPGINSLLDAANRGLEAIPGDNVKTVVDEAATALGGLGPEFSRFVNGSATLAIDAQKNIDDLNALIDGSQPILNSQTATASSIRAWASNLADITGQLRHQDNAVSGILTKGGPAAAEARALFDRLQPTLPIILANLVSVGEVAVTYQANIEQLLVLLPIGVADIQATALANHNTKQPYTGMYLSFNTGNINLPRPCTTGFLPAQQVRPPTFVDAPDRPPGDIYCRTPQDSMWNVRGARNTPCAGNPAKRAPTAALCESNEQYVPLNDGMSFKGDPNATLSGQPVPQPLPGQAAPPTAPAPEVPALAVAEYDPATGAYVGPDGNIYTQANLAATKTAQSWQSMLAPPVGN